MRLIHTSDWQLGKPFGRISADARAALQEARLDVIESIASLARTEGAPIVLVAGDVFDSAEPGDRVFRQAISRMKSAADIQWFLLPGNHDPARADGLWTRLVAEAPRNVVACLTPAPTEIGEATWLLPAPLAHKRTLEDPTAWFATAETPAGARRVGLAHGTVATFGGSADTTNLIAPDRARTAGLSYLALGDWHGRRKIDAATHYSGTPEPDDFDREVTGVALRVELAGAGEAPRIEDHPVGRFHWASEEWRLSTADDLDAALATLAPGVPRQNLVLRLSLTGLLTLSERVHVRERLEAELAHEVRWLDLRLGELFARPTDNDLAEIDANGVLREASDRLRTMVSDGGPAAARATAALERLFVEQQKSQRIQEA